MNLAAMAAGTSVHLTAAEISRFRTRIYRHYQAQGRVLPWRQTRNPYAILVSEVMLQQTQVTRVLGKYHAFLARFPDFAALAAAPLPEVLAAWQGLGYNRRALALKQLAVQVLTEHGGKLPRSEAALRRLPGLGPATAGAVLAFAFEEPVVFIETNIRRVYLHYFFTGQAGVRDRQLLPYVAATLDRERVRPWYYALMDYGVHLAAQGENPNRLSAHYRRQSPFPGSRRELRSLVLKTLLAGRTLTLEELARSLKQDPEKLRPAVQELLREGFLEQQGSYVRLKS